MSLSSCGLYCAAPEDLKLAEELALAWGLPLLEQPPAAGLMLVWNGARLTLNTVGKGAPGPVAVDWSEPKARRRLQTSGRAQPLARAAGFKPGYVPTVLDATAGLGQDAFVLAWLGAALTCMERSPVAAALLADGLRRALQHPELRPAAARMQLHWVDALSGLQEWRQTAQELASPTHELAHKPGAAAQAPTDAARPGAGRPDCVYLDPMYPDTGRSALSSKNMQAFQQVIGEDRDADALLQHALSVARRRVVVKRPRKAGFMAGEKPFAQLIGESTRYDIYMVWGQGHASD